MDEVQWRQFLSRVQDYVFWPPYPATKAEVIAKARRGNVPSDVLGMLLDLPERSFESPQDVVEQVRAAGPPPEHVK